MTSLLLGALLLEGCTAVRATYYIVDAEKKYQAAVAEGALEQAPYEITMASEFLTKAKEEDGYSDFGATEMLCRKSIEYSAAAYERSSDDGRPDVKDADEIVPEEKPEEPVKEE